MHGQHEQRQQKQGGANSPEAHRRDVGDFGFHNPTEYVLSPHNLSASERQASVTQSIHCVLQSGAKKTNHTSWIGQMFDAQRSSTDLCQIFFDGIL
jgi:hypothetical protein